MLTFLALGATLVVSLVVPSVLAPLLRRRGVMDVPNERSSHSRPVVRGVGISPMVAVAVGYLIVLTLGGDATPDIYILIVIVSATITAAALGAVEDVWGIPVVFRAAAQVLIGCASAAFLVGESWWLTVVLGLFIAGYINAANFMDGVNGISGLHAVAVGSTYAVIGAITTMPWLTISGLVLALAFAGFLPWNFARGGMFLGDVGSYLLGGGIAVIAAAAIAGGIPFLAVLGPLAIYLADTGTTLIKRMTHGERWYEAHRTHVYQQLTRSGLSHFQTAALVASFGGITGALGLLSLLGGWWVIGCAVAIVMTAVVYIKLPDVRDSCGKPGTRERSTKRGADKPAVGELAERIEFAEASVHHT